MKLKINVGVVDRVIRVVVGLALLVGGMVLPGLGKWIGSIVGAILCVTGIIGFCPLYALLKINTARK